MNDQVENQAGGDQVPAAQQIKEKRKFTFEDALYFGVYILYLVFGGIAVFKANPRILQHHKKFGIDSGYAMLNQPQDNSNEELRIFAEYMYNWFPFYLGHVILSAVGRVFWPGKHLIAPTLLSLGMLSVSLQWSSFLLISALFASYFLISKLNTKFGTWLLALTWMLVIQFLKTAEGERLMRFSYFEYYRVTIMISWGVLRGSSFNFNRIAASQEERDRRYTLMKFLGYAFYFPTMIFGPHLEYSRYVVAWETPTVFAAGPSHLKQLYRLACDILRAVFWWYFLQFAMHYLYIHFIAIDGVRMVKLIHPQFALHALGYFMGMYFYLYYLVCYGVGIALANYDGMSPPQPPRCIGRIHYYSDMWKYFDAGLYEYLFQHIYCQFCSRQSSVLRKLFATAVTFAFIFVWHGFYDYVLVWSILNFVCLVAEKILRSCMDSRWFDTHVYRGMGEKGKGRIRAILATQIFVPAAFANVYFIGGLEVGNYLMSNAYGKGFLQFAGLSFCTYCFFQCSEYIAEKQREKERDARAHID